MSIPILSIIVPFYNSRDFLRKCLLSCYSQDLDIGDYEVLAVDDGSFDGSDTIAEEFSKKYTNLILIRQSNKGLSAARNAGIRRASGKYILFLDSDDWILSNSLKKLITTCEDRKLDILRICACNVYGTQIKRRFSYAGDDSVYSGRELLNKKAIQICAPFSIYNSSFLISHHLLFFEGILHEDNEFSPRAYYHAERVSQVDDVVYYVFQSHNSITRSVNPKKSLDCITIMNNLDHFFAINNNLKQSVSSYYIASVMNVCLHDAAYVDREHRGIINTALFNNRHLYKHLFKSLVLRYILEYLALALFPKNAIQVYRVLCYHKI